MFEHAAKALQFYTEKLQLGFPSTKLGIVGIENYTSLGMENWSMMVFCEEYFLVNPETTFLIRQRIARLVAHEVGHTWFGNLVSITSFQFLWLKEGLPNCSYFL